MKKKHWEHFEHRADIGIRGFGNTISEAFAHAALAMTAVIVEPEKVKQGATISVYCEESDKELLLVDWLNAVIYEMTTRKMLFSGFNVTIHGSVLEAQLSGEGVDVSRHEPVVEVKGATYTELEVRRLGNGVWQAQCVVDV